MLGRHKWAPRHVVDRVNCRKCLRHATSVCVATALTCYNAPLCGSNCVVVVAKFMCTSGRQTTHRLWLCILPRRCQSMQVCVCATDSPLDRRVCKCSNIQVIVPAIRKSSSLIWHLSHLSYFFEIRNKMFIMLPEFFAPRWGT